MHVTYEPRGHIDITPQQYHAGLDKLWNALELTDPQDEDVFSLAAQAIVKNRLAKEANHGSMVIMQKLLRLLIPNRHKGCLCDGCVNMLIALEGDLNCPEKGLQSSRVSGVL